MPDESKPATLYKGQKSMPFFYQGKKAEISLDDVIDILLKERSAQYVCHKQPMHVQQNAIFLVNLSAVKLQDLPADDNGTYRHNGMRTWVFDVENSSGGKIKKKMVAKTALKPDQLRTRGNCVTIKRTYRKNKSCEDFMQIITYAEQNGSIVNNLAILHYLFKGEERSFLVTAHGNKKDKSVPFFPVNSTTRRKIKEVVKLQKPKKALAELDQEANMMSSTSSAAIPRDTKQISNMRNAVKIKERKDQGIPVHESIKDRLYSVLIMAVEEQSKEEEKYIHGVTAWPEAMCVVGLPYQFHDISRFCSNSLQFHPLGIDTIFNLGEFYVTPTAYKSLILENSTDEKSPTLVGPTLIHMSRSYSAFCHLAAKLREIDNGIGDLKCIVTDGEPGLIKAFQVFYPQMPLLRCNRHFRENCVDKLKSLGIKGEDQCYFVRCIFGSSVEDVYHEGLLDATDSETFDALLMSLQDEMNERELAIRPPGSSPQFFSWLQKHDVMMKSSLTEEARQNAGLKPGERITTNPSESVNHVLKEAANYEETSLPDFIVLSKAIAESQRQEVMRAIIRKGKYRFKQEFSFLEIPEPQWMHEMNQDQKKSHVLRVMQTELDAKSNSNATTFDPPNRTTPNPSVSYSQLQLNVPSTVLASIWNKASQYLATENAVVQAPSLENGIRRFSVHSRSSPCPNSVTLCDNGKMTCTCLMFKSSPNVCSHAVAAAEKANVISSYLEWLKQENKSYSMYEIATASVNKRAAGQKGGKPRRVRKAPATATSTTVSSNEWLLGIPPSQSDHMGLSQSFTKFSNSCKL